MKPITFFFLTLIIGSFLFISLARAVDVNVKFLETPDATAGKSAGDIAKFIATFYKFALGIAGIVAVGMITAGAIFYSVSGESPQAQSEGKDMIISALWGLGLLFGSYLILRTVNPQLVELKEPKMKKVVSVADCTEKNKNDPEIFSPTPGEKCKIGTDNILSEDGKCACYIPPETMSSTCPYDFFDVVSFENGKLAECPVIGDKDVDEGIAENKEAMLLPDDLRNCYCSRKVKGENNLPNDITIYYPNCSFDEKTHYIKDLWSCLWAKSEVLDADGETFNLNTIWRYPFYYPISGAESGGPDKAVCLPYAFREGDDYADTDGKPTRVAIGMKGMKACSQPTRKQ